MTVHADIGPSSLYRLLECPGSHQLSKTRRKGGSSVYAAEGTVAHEICEECLNDAKATADHTLGQTRSADGHSFIVDEEMVEGCNMYLEHCWSLTPCPLDGWYRVEQQVSLEALWADGPPEPIFGTADFVAFDHKKNHMSICDLKYGRGDVDPVENPQAMAYALGAVLTFGILPSLVDIYIVQPRGQQTQGVKHWQTTGLDLMAWGTETLKPGVAALMQPNAHLKPGSHCKFCPALAVCPALKQIAQETSREQFAPIPPSPNTLDNDELAHILNRAAVIKPWLDAVQAEASGRIDRGQNVPGWKLVPKRAVRTWTDKVAVTNWMKEKNLEDVTMNLVPKTPTQVQKTDPDVYKEMYDQGLIDDQSSGTTLVPDMDPREALIQRSAKDEFSET